LQFKADKVIQALALQLNDIEWSDQYGIHYVPNTKENLNQIYVTFKGVAWVNGNYFFRNRPLQDRSTGTRYHRKSGKKVKLVNFPQAYLEKLELKKYAENTAKTYISCFEAFMEYYPETPLQQLDENDVRRYLLYLIRSGRSNSYVNQAINSIKFYYEIVLGMPNRFYSVERPRKSKKLPKVLLLRLSPQSCSPRLVAAVEVAGLDPEFAHQGGRGMSSLADLAIHDYRCSRERAEFFA
jgi:hypothetical protein